jgi:oligopeptide/dipeptide ABC transporter ATP-binding protein
MSAVAPAPSASPVDAAAKSLIAFESVTKRYGERVAVEEASFALRAGRTLGIVGESGSGKTTCVRIALGLERPTEGRLAFHGQTYPRGGRGLRAIRRRIGFVFQDPYDSLDNRMTIERVVAEPLRIHGLADRGSARSRVAELLAAVGLPDAPLDSHPGRFSGGGRQRIAIARGLILDPEVLICDEPTASLDVSVQAQILNLLMDLRRERGVSIVFVSHDLDLIKRISDDVVVMYAGRVVEAGPTAEVVARPRHPYTAALLDAVPGEHPSRRKLSAREPATRSAGDIVRTGCVYASRCRYAQDACRSGVPPVSGGRTDVACLFPLP